MSLLERRCRSLLRAYPRWYRRQPGDEMLATLLKASQPGQRWPSARETRALIIGGLRVRAAQISYVGYGYVVFPELVGPAAVAGLLACGSFWRLRRQAVL